MLINNKKRKPTCYIESQRGNEGKLVTNRWSNFQKWLPQAAHSKISFCFKFKIGSHCCFFTNRESISFVLSSFSLFFKLIN